MAPATCASLPADVVRLRSSQTVSTWKITTMPISAIAAPIITSIRLKPRWRRMWGRGVGKANMASLS